MRGGLGLGCVLALAMACGSKNTDDFGDDPGQSGNGGEPSSGGSGASAAAGQGGSAMAGAGMGGSTGGSTGGSDAAGSSSGGVCAPGSTQACLGPGQCAGAQRCSAEGDGWGDCDCGTPLGGGGASGSSGTGGTESKGGAAGMPPKGGAGGGGSAGKGGGNGGSSGSGEACETDFCDAYCDATTGNCPDDGSREDCMTQCTETRCVTQVGCLDTGADYFRCVADSTPVCISDVSLPGDGDCRDVGTKFFDCLDVPWHCDEDADSCICSRTRDSTAPGTCEAKHDCCIASISAAACGCDDTEFCGDAPEGFIKVESCPLD